MHPVYSPQHALVHLSRSSPRSSLKDKPWIGELSSSQEQTGLKLIAKLDDAPKSGCCRVCDLSRRCWTVTKQPREVSFLLHHSDGMTSWSRNVGSVALSQAEDQSSHVLRPLTVATDGCLEEGARGHPSALIFSWYVLPDSGNV